MKKLGLLTIAFLLSGAVGATCAMEGGGSSHKRKGVKSLKAMFEDLAKKEGKEAKAQRVCTEKKVPKEKEASSTEATPEVDRCMGFSKEMVGLPLELIKVDMLSELEPKECGRYLIALMSDKRFSKKEREAFKEMLMKEKKQFLGHRLLTRLEKESRSEEGSITPALISNIKALIGDGADVNVKNECRTSALMLAAYESWPEIVRALLKAGADVNAQDNAGLTPLMLSVMAPKRCWVLVRDLLAGKADPTLTDASGDTALHLAIAGETDVGIIELLLNAGADPRATDNFGQTPLDLVEASQQNAVNSDPNTIFLLIKQRIKELEAKETPQVEMGPSGKQEE